MKKMLVLMMAMLVWTGCSSTKTETEEAINAEAKYQQERIEEEARAAKERIAREAEAAKAAAAAKAQEVANSESHNGEKMTCSLSGDERVIEVVKKNDSECEVHYTKFGTTSKIAEAQNGADYCDTVRDKVKGNLEAASFECSL